MADIQDNKIDIKEKEKKIPVAIRVRPLIAREHQNEELWEVIDSRSIRRKDSKPEKFQFDRVFDGSESNLDVYNDLCKSIIEEVIKGFNATIFAYGQTSSGKTFTMMGEHNGITKGVIHYAIADIFEMMQNMTNREFLLRVSVLEIYNEKVYDLLSEKNDDLRLLEDCYGVLNISGLEERIVQTSDQIWDLMLQGQTKRRTGKTQMNRSSSRSHFIFRMILESSFKGDEDPIVNVSHLNLVDLAGSENVKQTKSTGLRFREGIHINKSLSTLTQVIKQLSEKHKHQTITYRNSKLTRILENSLGGNAHTAIICTVTPAVLNETLSTLNFASSAKNIKNKPQKNEIFTDQALLKQYANKIKKLSEELKATKEQGELELEEKQRQNENLKKQIQTLKANFVCQTPESKAKATRRETWGGAVDRRRFFDSRNRPCLQLTNIYEEEYESESELPDLIDSMKQRNSRGTSRSSCSSVLSICSTKNIHKDVGVQTNNDFFEENVDIDELMTMVSDLKSELTTLQSEFEEHVEYTSLEKQMLKAEHELQVENEELKAENAILKRKLASKSLLETSHLTSFNESKQVENNNETLECNKNKMGADVPSTNVLPHNFDNSLVSEKYDSNKSVKEISRISNCESTLLDESHDKSNFLALYDDCIESEMISKLKLEIEVLKHDLEIKNKQLTLLNDKICIKDQFIVSLQDEIALNKNTDFACDNMKNEVAHEVCQTDFIQASPTKSLRKDISMKYIMEDKFTEVTPVKSKELSTQYCKREFVHEHFVQTSPIRDLNWLSEYIFNENLKVDRYSEISDSFREGTLDIDSKERKTSELFDQSSQTSPVFFRDSNSVTDNEVFISNSSDAPKEAEICDCGYFSDETKILIKKVSDLKHYACSILKKCTKTEYLKDADEYLSDVNDCSSKSALENMADLENLVSNLGYYVSNTDEDCKIINNQLELKFQEINSLDAELSNVKQALCIKESELSSLCNLFFDLKQSFSQLTFICQVLNNVDSQEKFAEIKERASVPIPTQSCKLEYEMLIFKNHFVKLNSYIEETASNIISLSEDLKKVKSELAATQREGFKLLENNCVSKKTATKSVQTSQDQNTGDEVEKEQVLCELINEKNNLLEQINYLEDTNKNLKRDINDLYNSDSERIEDLKRDITNTWKIKTEMLVKDLEQKYDQELIDQEKNFAEELRIKVQEAKQENLKQLQELKEEIEKMKMYHSEELSAIRKQYEDQLASAQSEKELLKHHISSEYEKNISKFKEKYLAKQKEHRKIYSQLNARLQHYMEEIENLKNENTPSNQLQVIEKLKEKISEISDERDILQKMCTRAELQITELKEHNKHLKHEIKKITENEPKQNILTKISKLEETNKELLYDLDQRKAKIMALQSNNTSMLQELKKLKEMQSSKSSCKCKNISKESNSDVSEKNEDKKDRKNKINCKEDLDEHMKVNTRQKVTNENATPQNNDYSNNRTPDQNAILCVGGGSGPANMIKSYWLEGIVHKKDKEIEKLREELGDLKSQLKNIKLQPVIKEGKVTEIKETEVKKREMTKNLISPLQEVDENVTVQLKTLHPYHGGAVPKMPRKHASREKNVGMTNSKPYDKHQNVERIKKENIAFDWQHPVNSDVNKHEPQKLTKFDMVNQLADPECKQQ